MEEVLAANVLDNPAINPNLTAYAPNFISTGLKEAVAKTLTVGCSDGFLPHLDLKSVNMNSQIGMWSL